MIGRPRATPGQQVPLNSSPGEVVKHLIGHGGRTALEGPELLHVGKIEVADAPVPELARADPSGRMCLTSSIWPAVTRLASTLKTARAISSGFSVSRALNSSFPAVRKQGPPDQQRGEADQQRPEPDGDFRRQPDVEQGDHPEHHGLNDEEQADQNDHAADRKQRQTRAGFTHLLGRLGTRQRELAPKQRRQRTAQRREQRARGAALSGRVHLDLISRATEPVRFHSGHGCRPWRAGFPGKVRFETQYGSGRVWTSWPRAR
jgi:hypothetical protein